MAKRKARALTRSTRQTGKSDMARDRKRKALAPGKRRSKKGNIYYENRKNRSDVKGRDTPVIVKGRKVAKTINVAKTKIPFTAERKRRIYKEYRKNEENNYHTENAIMLIKLFGTPTQYKTALQIKRNRDKRGLTKAESDYLYKYGHSHFNKIKPASVNRVTKKRTLPVISAEKRARLLSVMNQQKNFKTKEPLRGVRRHALLPVALRNKIPKLYSQDGKKDPMVYAKFFSPYSGYTFYITEFDGKDTFFGYVSNGQGSGWGYSSFMELAKANRRGLPLIERDMYFSPKRASKIQDIKRLKR